ncbi:NDP-hexose 2,3-dehydratase family protein [Nocardia transvalensis]|nr:NDP-hexose 2,3-dehydratase family protein [Nocardia transvalensis]
MWVSATTTAGIDDLERFHDWFGQRYRMHSYSVERVPLETLAGWHFADDTGDLVHDSGRFFSIAGLRVSTDFGRVGSWRQPVIIQPEIGVLGILVKQFDGVLHCLMQAKMEPGNINTLQLSPTVQATRSNYSGVHRGRRVPYLEYFSGERPGRVVADVLHSEQAAWFLHKRNRNMIVETTDDVPLLDGFCWLTLGQLGRLLRIDNLVNMDARTVLSTVPLPSHSPAHGALHPMNVVLSRLTSVRARYELVQQRLPLKDVLGDEWQRYDGAIRRPDGKHFEIIGVDVRADQREVSQWSQPLLAPLRGLAGLIVRRIDGVLHALMHIRIEAGELNVAEFAPTVQCTPEHYRDAPAEQLPLYYDAVVDADPDRVRFDALLSEEGGRFFHSVTRNIIVEADADFPVEVPAEYCWIAVHQAQTLLQHSNYINVQGRTLLACLNLAIHP